MNQTRSEYKGFERRSKPSECNPELFDFARVEGRAVVATFDGGRITSDAGALLLHGRDTLGGRQEQDSMLNKTSKGDITDASECDCLGCLHSIDSHNLVRAT